jgi:hypothetical protein
MQWQNHTCRLEDLDHGCGKGTDGIPLPGEKKGAKTTVNPGVNGRAIGMVTKTAVTAYFGAQPGR